MRRENPWQNNITGYEPGTVGVKINNGFGGEEEALDVSMLNCFHLIFPIWKTSVVTNIGSALCAINTFLTPKTLLLRILKLSAMHVTYIDIDIFSRETINCCVSGSFCLIEFIQLLVTAYNQEK